MSTERRWPGCVYEMVAMLHLTSDQWERLSAGHEITLYPGNVEWTKMTGRVGIPVMMPEDLSEPKADDAKAN